MTASNTANGEYRIGMKHFYDLCPFKVRESITNFYKIKDWDGPNKLAMAAISRKISEFEAQNTGFSNKKKKKRFHILFIT